MNPRLLYRLVVIGATLALCVPSVVAFGQAAVPTAPDQIVSPASQTVPVPLTDVKAIAAGASHTCALMKTAGAVKCWGSNSFGELGDGNYFVSSHTPVDVLALSDVTAIAAGSGHTCALTDAGGVKCWGDNEYGQLGIDHVTPYSDTPVNVTSLDSGVAAIAAGGIHTCALIKGGGVKCWGYNHHGQLGDGTYTQRDTPTTVHESTGFKAVAAGAQHTCALTEAGGVKCWGDNEYGQLGDDNAPTDRNEPVNVYNLDSGIKAIAAGARHSCALTDGGSARCWGLNDRGQVGTGSATDYYDMPQIVQFLGYSLRETAAGGYHTCVVTASAGVKCWGKNSYGQLGDGTRDERRLPVDVIGLAAWVDAISAGTDHTCVLTTGGTVKCWGKNHDGQLGDSTGFARSIPGDVLTTATCYKLSRIHTGQGGNPVAEPGSTPGCPAGHYLKGENIALFANANDGWRVNGWSNTKNDASLNDVNSLAMPAADTTVTVTYAPCRALTCAHAGSGGDPIAAPAQSLNCPAATYVAGETIVLIAKPNADQRVKQWSGTDTNPGVGMLVNTLTMPASTCTVEATYEACFLLSAQVTGSGDPLTATPAASTGCAAGRYVAGQSIVLTAAPASGWSVEGWSGTSDDSSTTASNSMVMPGGDHSVGVVYGQGEGTGSLYLPALRR